MATECNGLMYFPTKCAFFEGAMAEILEAKHGIKGPYLMIKLLCKIYKEEYFIPWDEEQCEIFAYKLRREYTKTEVADIIDTLLEKDFFDKKSYEEHQILTSADIQRVWVEATSRRKRCMDKLPFLLIDPKCKQPEGLTPRNDNNAPTQKDLNFENTDISQQSKVEESKVEESRKKKEKTQALPPPPDYALNKQTHNYEGLLLTLNRIRVTDIAEIEAILRLSNYGEKNTPIWKILAQTVWTKIGMPGKYLIKVLKSS